MAHLNGYSLHKEECQRQLWDIQTKRNANAIDKQNIPTIFSPGIHGSGVNSGILYGSVGWNWD
jgi:hypothetical protein